MSLLIYLFTFVILIFSSKFEVVTNPTDSFSNSDVELRIVGGKEARDGQFPYAAGIITLSQENKTGCCGGSLINTTTVLTAGHCLHGVKAARVILGARNLNKDSAERSKQAFDSTNFIFHPNYNASTTPPRHDLAIIKLRVPAKLNSHVKIIHIPWDDKKTYAKMTGTVMGWGISCPAETFGHFQSLMYENNTILTNSGCQKTNAYMKNRLLDTHMCHSGKGGKGACNGDSGGPLVVEGVLVGVLAFAHRDCAHGKGYACVATRLSKYIEWINANSH